MADNALTRLPLAGQLGVSAVIAALICGGFCYFWYADALEQQRQKEARLADLQKQIRALEATANRLPEFQREVQALEARLETLKRILPPEKEMPDLMRRIQYLAAQSSLQIRLADALDELTSGLRSIRQLADTLDRHPEALLKGKEPSDGDR